MMETAWRPSGEECNWQYTQQSGGKKAKEWANEKFGEGVVGPFGQRCMFENSLQSGSQLF